MKWSDKRVVVTGGAGFLGSFVVEKLRERGGRDLVLPRSKEFDLRDCDAIVRLYKKVRPHIVIHLAAVVGGIGANRVHPGRFFYDDAIMGIQLMEYARQFGVEKFVAAGTVCAYPKFTPLHSTKTICGMVIPKKRTRPMVLPRKCCSCRP